MFLNLKKNIRGLSLILPSVTDQPYTRLTIFLLVNLCRSQNLEILNNLKPFQYLINLAISLTEDMSKKLGLRYIVLSPDNDDLKDKYINVGF